MWERNQIVLANETSIDSLKDAVKKHMRDTNITLIYQIGHNNTNCNYFLILKRSKHTEFKTCLHIVPPCVVVCKKLRSSENQTKTSENQ